MKLMFAIRHKPSKKFLGIRTAGSCSDPDSTFCGQTAFEFVLPTSDLSEQIWVTQRSKEAEKALKYDPPWFNSGMASPMWPKDINPKACEIVELVEKSP